MYKSEKWLKRGNLFFDILGYWYVRGVGLYWLIKIVDYNEYFKVLWKNDVLMIIVIIFGYCFLFGKKECDFDMRKSLRNYCKKWLMFWFF